MGANKMSGSKLFGWPTLCAGLLLAGCVPAPGADEPAGSQSDLFTLNGLSMINGLSMTNGLSMINGLSMTNGLSGDGLVSGSDLMNTAAGRTTVAYMVRCALPSGATITKQDADGVSYTFPGMIGVAPAW